MSVRRTTIHPSPLPIRTHVLFEGSPGVLVDDGIVIEGVDLDGVLAAVGRAVDATTPARRIELCGGMPVQVAAQVQASLPDDVELGVNRYGFESLDQAAAYKAAFDDPAGDAPGDLTILYAAATSTPLAQHDGVLVAGVGTRADLADRAVEALHRGAGLVELYGGLGVVAADVVREATRDAIPVGYC